MAQTARSTRSSSALRAPAKARRAPAKAAPKPKLQPLKGGVVDKPAAPTPEEEPKRVSAIVPRGYVPLVDIPKLPPPPKLTLSVGDKAVHPAHGLGEVISIEHREIGGAKGEFYVLRILDNGMRVMVPRGVPSAAGLRPVMSAKEADQVLETMRARQVAVDLQPWSRRFRAYTEMIKSGAPH